MSIIISIISFCVQVHVTISWLIMTRETCQFLQSVTKAVRCLYQRRAQDVANCVMTTGLLIIYVNHITFVVVRPALHSLVSRERCRSKKAVTCDSHINLKYLSSAEKDARLRILHQKNRCLELKTKNLTAKIEKLLDCSSVVLDDDTSKDFHHILLEEDKHVTDTCAPDSFKRIFWEQQKRSLLQGGKGMHWHPLMIKWYLYLHHQSSKAYEALRDSGVISLPSQQILRDYSNCVKAKPGFSYDVDLQLMKAGNVESCPQWHKLVVLLLDEMYIKEDLVYDKHTGKMIGFVDLGETNNHLLAYEKALEEDTTTAEGLATSVFVIMVKGLFTPLRYPYAHFPSSTLTGNLLFEPFWEAVFRLERMDFKVWYAVNIHLYFLYFRY